MPINLLFENPAIFVAWLAAIIFGITIHEYSHVLAAYVQGDQTGKQLGRLSLNPLVHLDMMGLLLLVVAGFGWGRPAPFNPMNLRSPRLGTMLVAIAGPISNLLAIVVFGLVFRLVLPMLGLGNENLLVIFLIFLIQINLVLMLFNLIPIPPLDGSRILFGLLPPRFLPFAQQFERTGPFLLLFLILFGGGIFSRLFQVVYDVAVKIIG